MSSHESTNVSSTDLIDRIDAGARTELAEPIKIDWNGRTRSKIEGRCLDASNPNAELFLKVSDRLKTKLEIRTAEEAAAVLFELSRYDPSRTWVNATMARSMGRVQDEVATALRERGYTVTRNRGVYKVLDTREELEDDADEERIAMADGGDTCESCGESITHAVAGHDEKTNSCGCTVETDGGAVQETDEEAAEVSLDRFECADCGFEDAGRDAFNRDGLAMECPDCGSVRVSHVFTVDDEDAEIMADGGVTWYELHHFKRDTLRVAAEMTANGDRMAGLDIKNELEKRYNTEIHHGRLYPNLDGLVDMDLLEKGKIDRRTNSYELTDQAVAMLRRQQETWEGLELPKLAVADGGDA